MENNKFNTKVWCNETCFHESGYHEYFCKKEIINVTFFFLKGYEIRKKPEFWKKMARVSEKT